MVFRTAKEKYFAVADEIAKLHEKKQPVLVGTTSIEKSELLSQILARKGVRHVVLNAKFHEREAEIVAQAGRLGMVTIATNMAGRGTDILLGGNPEFVARQELVKKAQARAIARRRARSIPRRRPGMLRFYYQGQEFETSQENWERGLSRDTRRTRPRSTKRWWRRAGCTFWARSGTSRGASTTSCAGARDGRAIRARRAFICRSKTT